MGNFCGRCIVWTSSKKKKSAARTSFPKSATSESYNTQNRFVDTHPSEVFLPHSYSPSIAQAESMYGVSWNFKHQDSHIPVANNGLIQIPNYNVPKPNRRAQENLDISIYTVASTNSLQHISEREPEDIEMDPSLNPVTQTLFMQRPDIRRWCALYDRNILNRCRKSGGLQRSSSTSSVYLDNSTVSRPDPRSTIKAVALAIFLQIRYRDRHNNANNMPEIFDERIHPLHKTPIPDEVALQDPDPKYVYRFIRTIFQMVQLSPECAIVMIVYLERLLSSAEIQITPTNWKRIVLCAILLASKVWDDQAVWNVDYCQILTDVNVDDVNELERQFLEIIQFNINIPSSVYAKYYFEIRSLFDSVNQVRPLSVRRARELEASSLFMVEPTLRTIQLRRRSLDDGGLSSTFRPAILS